MDIDIGLTINFRTVVILSNLYFTNNRIENDTYIYLIISVLYNVSLAASEGFSSSENKRYAHQEQKIIK